MPSVWLLYHKCCDLDMSLTMYAFLSAQGIKPDSFYNVKVPELKEIIEGCIRMNNDER